LQLELPFTGDVDQHLQKTENSFHSVQDCPGQQNHTQTEAKAVFFHREFGIKAGLPFFSRQFIQVQNAGIMIPAAQSKATFSGVLMLDGLSVTVL
jgi:hypothetical protein